MYGYARPPSHIASRYANWRRWPAIGSDNHLLRTRLFEFMPWERLPDGSWTRTSQDGAFTVHITREGGVNLYKRKQAEWS